ncbi:GIN domain-containing protein [Pedobacter cryoconitis]|uniref:Putative auto-transporter adhesin head GIN domain-containing protein n=1 Tax=Pedobacter cryoconitis TaxID=188932 RepID=A0A7X0MH84_9SPHI|nr:DUF2807 domain-containing protein [Pedobacter cryoconitis]MBB6498874.1 hypothetical protein [Pedobacter cryoconitis]
MNTTIKTVFATAMTAVVLTSSAFTTFAKENEKNPLSLITSTSSLNMIRVKGNVKVYLIQGAKEDIKVITDQQGEKVSLKREGKKLLISSTEQNRAIVYLTVKDLIRIDASDNAIVKSSGDFNLTNLQIFLQDDAQVNMDVKAQDVYTVIKDGSSLKLSGSTARLTSVKDGASKLNTNNFSATSTTASAVPLTTKADLDTQFADTLNFVSLINR